MLTMCKMYTPSDFYLFPNPKQHLVKAHFTDAVTDVCRRGT